MTCSRRSADSTITVLKGCTEHHGQCKNSASPLDQERNSVLRQDLCPDYCTRQEAFICTISCLQGLCMKSSIA